MGRELDNRQGQAPETHRPEEDEAVFAEFYHVVQNSSPLASESPDGAAPLEASRLLQLLWDTWECEKAQVLLRPYHVHPLHLVEPPKSKAQLHLAGIWATLTRV